MILQQLFESSNLTEFAPGSGDDGEEETLHKYARMWYNGDERVQQQVEQILARMGWEIGELESEEGGAFVVQSGDENGDSYIGFAVADLTEAVAEGSDDQVKKVFKKNGKPVGEVGIDPEASPGNGQWYMKCYAYNIDNSGYDSYKEAVEELKYCLKQGVAEAGPYSSRNPDTMSSNEYDRYQQDQMDQGKRNFKRREHEAEWEQEKAYSDKLAARDAGTWYVRINGKIVKDKQGNAYTFQGKAAANKAALTMQAKPFNKGKQFMLTTNPNDTVEESVAKATPPTQKKQQVSENRYIPKHKRW